MNSFLELAERCEAATGPDRELDTEIYITVKPDGNAPWGTLVAASRHPDRGFTASLDAAMSLVPEGVIEWHAGKHFKSENGAAYILAPWSRDPFYVVGATPALALTAACLRSHAAKEERR
jgi:hypothetical protein